MYVLYVLLNCMSYLSAAIRWQINVFIYNADAQSVGYIEDLASFCKGHLRSLVGASQIDILFYAAGPLTENTRSPWQSVVTAGSCCERRTIKQVS